MNAAILNKQMNFSLVNTGSFQSYLDSVQQIPILSREEEVALFHQFKDHDDLESARKIVLSHLRYVAYIARSYMGYGLPLEDLVQQGNVGLMKSVKKFNTDHEVRLVTFAVHWIRAEIHEYILKNWKIVKVATTKAQRKLFFNLRKAKARLGWFNSEEVNAVARDLKVKPEEVLEMESRLGNFDESFDAPINEGEDTIYSGPSNYLTQGEDPADLAAKDEISKMHSDGLAQALQMLDERTRDIIESRWLAQEKMGLKALSEKYGISMERIRQIEAKALEKMQLVMTVEA
ncbi:MAG: RNA polymerase sigma factor RpoH [Pseudomonadales bacterium]|nr:RNA polymerase sigma factor RpoH [Pseudomonadales bacterium]